MSLINDALQRARREVARRDAARRGLPLPPSPPTSRSGGLAVAVAALTLALAVCLAALFVLYRQGEVAAPQLSVAAPSPTAESGPRPEPQRLAAEIAGERPQSPTLGAPGESPAAEATPAARPAPPIGREGNVEVSAGPPSQAARPAAFAAEPEDRGGLEIEPREAAVFVRQARLDDGTIIELGGIAWSEQGPFALLNGEVVGTGEPVAGLTVLRIEPQLVELTGAAGNLVIHLK